jgi:subfamily B ATP-binding cassette protein MsbA
MRARSLRRHFKNRDPIQGQLGEREALLRLARKAWSLRVWILVALFFSLVGSVVNLGWGKLAKDLIDRVTQVGGKPDLAFVNQYALMGIAIVVFRGLVDYANKYAWSYAANRLAVRLRSELFEHLQRLPLSFYNRRKTGQIVSCLSSDVQGAVGIVDVIQDLSTAPFILVGGMAMLLWLNWTLALVGLLSLPVVAGVIRLAARKMSKHSQGLVLAKADVADQAQETLSSIRTVKAFGNEAYEAKRFAQRNWRSFKSQMRTVSVRQLTRPVLELLSFAALVLVIWVGAMQIATGGSFTLGDLGWFLLVLGMMGQAVQDLGKITLALSGAGVCADRVFTLLAEPDEVLEAPGARNLAVAAGRIEFDHVSFQYEDGEPVLRDVSFTVEPGEVVALVGQTGAGKTTVASLIQRYYDVTAGAIRVDGVDLRECTIKSLRANIGVVPQEPVLFAGTLAENIAYGRLNAAPEEIEQAARLSNAWEFIERLPAGLETAVGERGATLSGGQRQRIAIARAILRNPRILILDEATSSLDARSEALVQAALNTLVESRTTLVIAHRLSTIRNADRILVMQGGQVAETGTHDELLALGGIYADLYATQRDEQAA